MSTASFTNYVCLLLVGFSSLFTACIKKEKGCRDPLAINHNPDAFHDDGSCIYQYDSLFTPTAYHFLRGNKTSVDLSLPSTHQLLIKDIKSFIANINTPVVLDTFLQLYTSIPDRATLTTGDFTPLFTNYTAITNTDISLAEILVTNFNADSIIRSAFDTITLYSQQAELLGTPALYTTQSGIDLQELIEKTLLGAGNYAQAVSLLNNIIDLSDEGLIDNTNYTPREYAWDLAFGYFGATITNAIGTFEDSNLDGKIDFTTEYQFSFAKLAEQLNFKGLTIKEDIFQDFLAGRLLISNGLDATADSVAIVNISNQILMQWESVIAEEIVTQLTNLFLILDGASQEDKEAISKCWTAATTWLGVLRYNPANRLGTVNTILLQLGQQPIFEDINGSYSSKLSATIGEIKAVYDIQ